MRLLVWSLSGDARLGGCTSELIFLWRGPRCDACSICDCEYEWTSVQSNWILIYVYGWREHDVVEFLRFWVRIMTHWEREKIWEKKMPWFLFCFFSINLRRDFSGLWKRRASQRSQLSSLLVWGAGLNLCTSDLTRSSTHHRCWCFLSEFSLNSIFGKSSDWAEDLGTMPARSSTDDGGVLIHVRDEMPQSCAFLPSFDDFWAKFWVAVLLYILHFLRLQRHNVFFFFFFGKRGTRDRFVELAGRSVVSPCRNLHLARFFFFQIWFFNRPDMYYGFLQ